MEITEDRVFLDRYWEPEHVIARAKAQGLSEPREITTDHKGPSGKPYKVRRMAVVCGLCGKPQKIAAINRRRAVHFHGAWQFTTDLCRCE